ncbi:hypothetical protein D7Y13_05955 [Corallococcus praedator]|uniref:Bacterial surface antigen (D15) domain-containing protein n=1 Tax=Corallococcus praedator TaxID=2316724 RepID=A0ABX9QNB9_9BACT|nr:hypothetical protein D7X75_12255 [Corallococcus sp. CA031C]RKI14543.1 hypothetical protein D7Y13_05955 [Corallococcus praedator]
MNRIVLCLCFVSLAVFAQPARDAGTLPPDAGALTAPSGTRAHSQAETPGDDGSRDDDGPDDDGPDNGAPRVGASNDGSPDGDASDRKASSRREVCPGGFDDDEDSDTASVLAPLRLDVDGKGLAPTALELVGLRHLTDAQVRSLVGAPAAGPTPPMSPDDVQTLLRRLARTGLFAHVEPRLRVSEQGPALLEVTLEEHPTVTSVDVQGLQDLPPDEWLEALFPQPPGSYEDGDEDDDEHEHGEVVATVRIHGRTATLSVINPCPPLHPPRELFARLERGKFRPGIVLGGLDAALERALKDLRDDDGYLLATLSATLSHEGALVVTVDEGRLEAVDVPGVEPEMAARVREALGLAPGDVFLRSDARRAVERLESQLPFLRTVDGEGLGEERRSVRIIEEREAQGTRRYRTQEQERPSRHREPKEPGSVWRSLFSRHEREEGITLEGRRLVVHVRPRRPDLSMELLPVHTQVTGFAPGLAADLRFWDPKDRVHATLDAAFFVPLRLGGQRLPDDPEGTRRQRRVSLLGGAKLHVPALGLAEVGAQVHDFTDTLDRWRLGDIDSYVYSFLINRPDRDYFRRKGFAAFATWRWARSWLAGAEFHGDTYESLQAFTPPLSLFRRDSPAFPNAPVSEGRFHSVVLRAEYDSKAKPGSPVGSLFRTPETSLFRREGDRTREPALRGLVTLEVGQQVGVDTRFWKLVGDAVLDLPVNWHSGLSVRLRVAGGEDLPLQKQEALGGWSTLRGFGFKDFRGGDASVLGSAEYRWQAFGIFADLGSVHAASDWTDPRLGLGASFHFSDAVRVEAAWRTDEKARATPEARLLFVRTF